MEYPNITLKIHNQVPGLELRSDGDNARRISHTHVGLDTLLMEAQDIVGSRWSIAELWSKVRSADEAFFDFPGYELSDEWDFSPLLSELRKERDKLQLDPNWSPEVREEILANWQQDMLASTVDAIYILIIADLLEKAEEMGIEQIVLDDERKEPRLQEKLAQVLAEFNLELTIS